MISVVICSVSDAFARQVRENIDATIGVEWEPIIISNNISPKSITQVYNSGASMATNDLICFVHEDVLFQTPNWGGKISEYFTKDRDLGLVGVAGSKYKSKTPSGWYTGISEFDCCNITHQDRNNQLQRIHFNPVPGSQMQPAVVLDGVFLCCRKAVWEQIRFDEDLLKEFHLYDLDFSLRVSEKYKVIVTFEVDILHLVKGMHYGDSWLKNTLIWHRNIRHRLPACIDGIKSDQKAVENKIRRIWLIRLKHEHIRFSNKLRWLSAIRIWFHISSWPYTVLFFIKNNKKT